MKLIDIHAHLESKRFESDLDEVIERAKKAGIKVIVNSGVNRETNRQTLEMAKKYNIVKASFGIYPIDGIMSEIGDAGEEGMLRHVEKLDVDEELKWIEENKDKCVAIGEVGLDYKVAPGTEDLQKAVFSKVIALAKKLDKPVVIHSRKAEEDAIDMLEEAGMKEVVMHSFNGKKSLIRRVVENGWYFSVPPVITRLDHFKMLVEMVPIGQLLTETDAPYLSPIAGERNESANVAVTVRVIAEIKGISEEEVAEKIWENAKGLGFV
jgi:TatD DNase family protein